jgi:hypothetical protein
MGRVSGTPGKGSTRILNTLRPAFLELEVKAKYGCKRYQLILLRWVCRQLCEVLVLLARLAVRHRGT